MFIIAGKHWWRLWDEKMPKVKNDPEVKSVWGLVSWGQGCNGMCRHPVDRPADGKSVMVLPHTGESWVLYVQLAVWFDSEVWYPGNQIEVSVTDLLSLFLTKIYVLVFSAFNTLFLEKQRKTEFYRYTCLNCYHHSCFHSSLRRLPLSTPSPPILSTHPVPDPRELRLFKGKR